MLYFEPLSEWRCGVVVNTLPCQGRDRGFEPRHFRTGRKTRCNDFIAAGLVLLPNLIHGSTFLDD